MKSPARHRLLPDSLLRALRVWRGACSVLVFATLGARAGPAHADWPQSPLINVPVCSASDEQYFQRAVPDGQGGVIVAWADERSDTLDVYAQRISAAGVPLWTAQGVRLCGAPWEQSEVTLLEDGEGGAVVVWRDDRARWESDLFAQRIDASGSPLWGADGVPVCRAAGDQVAPRLVRSDHGTTIVVWEDRRVTGEIYAQRLSATGARLWDSSGVALSTAAAPRFEPVAATDGVGGAIVLWTQQSASGYDVVGQRIADIGVRMWGPTGVVVGGGTGDQLAPAIVEGGQYRVFIAWEDHGVTGSSVRVQTMDINAVVFSPAWDGLVVAAPSRVARRPVLESDGGTGALVAWHEAVAGGEDVRVQRLAADAQARWTAGGVLVSAHPAVQQFPSLMSDGRGGALVAWEDLRAGNWDVYAQRLDTLGARRWGADGRAVSAAAASQLGPRLVGERDTVAIVVWTDQRVGDTDLYAQRMPMAVALSAPRPAPPLLALRASPNPAREAATLAFDMASPQRARLTLYDAAGRSVCTLVDGELAGGAHRVVWDGRDASGRAAAPGIYLARLVTEDREARLTLVRGR